MEHTKRLEQFTEVYKGDRFYQEVFNNEEYWPVVDRIPKYTVIDCGALAGEFSVWIYPFAKQVYAVEPYSEHFKELEDNFAKLEMKNAKAYRLALGKENKDMFLNVHSRGGHTVTEVVEQEHEVVPCVTLANFMATNDISKVDILKIDIEDGETNVFTAADFKKVASKIKFIIGEHLEGLVPLLTKLGFKATQYNYGYYFERAK